MVSEERTGSEFQWGSTIGFVWRWQHLNLALVFLLEKQAPELIRWREEKVWYSASETRKANMQWHCMQWDYWVMVSACSRCVVMNSKCDCGVFCSNYILLLAERQRVNKKVGFNQKWRLWQVIVTPNVSGMVLVMWKLGICDGSIVLLLRSNDTWLFHSKLAVTMVLSQTQGRL